MLKHARADPPVDLAGGNPVPLVSAWTLAVFALGLVCSPAGAVNPASPSGGGGTSAISGSSDQSQQSSAVDFHGEIASAAVREVVNWVSTSGDNHALPFVIVDKVNAKVFLFGRHGDLRGAAAALLGLARGDDGVAGIGQRKLAAIRPSERTTPAGRFVAALGHDLEQDILWIDYDAALSLHRVIVGTARDHRAQRLASASPLDNRISFGCINVPPAFYDTVVVPAFTATTGIVYILPETKPISDVFPLSTQRAHLDAGGSANAR